MSPRKTEMLSEIRCLILIVLDSLGIGALPDAEMYGDKGSNTLKHITEKVGGVNLPYLESLGLGHLGVFQGIASVSAPDGAYGVMAEASAGKDTTTGHWEMMGLILESPFPTYPDGFPDEIIEPFKQKIGTGILGNYAASGTDIIKQLGESHLKTGYPIVYTSADSVFQIAAHEDIIPVENLYAMCKVARNILTGDNGVSRVIARPFIGKPGDFHRTSRRKDFSVSPPEKTLLNTLQDMGILTIGIGKINDIFAHEGLGKTMHASNNEECVNQTIDAVMHTDAGFIFTNLVDFDMLYGHRNDVQGYAEALEVFDQRLPDIFNIMHERDVLIITADHGCDPTTESTDHSREYVPLLVYGKTVRKGSNLGVRQTFADLGQTIAEIFQSEPLKNGISFMEFL